MLLLSCRINAPGRHPINRLDLIKSCKRVGGLQLRQTYRH